MNSLSWLIYWADVSYTLKAVACVLAAGCIIVALWIAASADRWSWPSTCLMVVGEILIIGQAFIPSKEGLYLIAASEMGEQVAEQVNKSETAKKSALLLNKWMDQKIKELDEKAGGEK